MSRPRLHCALYTRKSTEEGLEQAFNTLDAQREACEAYVKSQASEGWRAARTRYDDGGFSGASMERPALKRLLCDIEAGKVDVIVVYKIDRLTRSLADFARMIEIFDRCRVSFVSVTQAFNTTTSMGRLTLNVLLSFAQFEREVTGERIRDKIAASKAKGMWMGGIVPLGYDPPANGTRALAVSQKEAGIVRTIFGAYIDLGSVHTLQRWLEDRIFQAIARTIKSPLIFRGGFERNSRRHWARRSAWLMLRPPRPRACGWGALCRLATSRLRMTRAPWRSTRKKPRSCAPSSEPISTLVPCTRCSARLDSLEEISIDDGEHSPSRIEAGAEGGRPSGRAPLRRGWPADVADLLLRLGRAMR